jgi:hypothetical protein
MGAHEVHGVARSRRTFLRDAGGALVSLGAASLAPGALTGCAVGVRETRDAVLGQAWEANPIIPVPPVGCYTGLSTALHRIAAAEGSLASATRVVKAILEGYTQLIGKPPTICAISACVPGPWNVVNETFPTNRCRAAIATGAIPLLKYQLKPFTTFAEITAGKFDEALRAFATQAKAFGQPYFFIPFGESNVPHRSYFLPFAGRPPEEYCEAHIYMHRLFGEVGANANTVWVVQTVTSPVDRAPGPFYPGDAFVDWIGFTVQNRTMMRQWYQDFRYFFREDYAWVRREHPTKPIILVELGKSNDGGQPTWLRRAYQALKEEFPGIKAAGCWEGQLRTNTGQVLDDQSTLTNPDSIQVRREALADPYFIRRILPS